MSFWLFIFGVRAHRAVFLSRAHRSRFLLPGTACPLFSPCVVFWEHRANFLAFLDTSCPNSFAFLTLTGTPCCFLLRGAVTIILVLGTPCPLCLLVFFGMFCPVPFVFSGHNALIFPPFHFLWAHHFTRFLRAFLNLSNFLDTFAFFSVRFYCFSIFLLAIVLHFACFRVFLLAHPASRFFSVFCFFDVLIFFVRFLCFRHCASSFLLFLLNPCLLDFCCCFGRLCRFLCFLTFTSSVFYDFSICSVFGLVLLLFHFLTCFLTFFVFCLLAVLDTSQHVFCVYWFALFVFLTLSACIYFFPLIFDPLILLFQFCFFLSCFVLLAQGAGLFPRFA